MILQLCLVGTLPGGPKAPTCRIFSLQQLIEDHAVEDEKKSETGVCQLRIT
jgi:hypothetical protein